MSLVAGKMPLKGDDAAELLDGPISYLQGQWMLRGKSGTNASAGTVSACHPTPLFGPACSSQPHILYNATETPIIT